MREITWMCNFLRLFIIFFIFFVDKREIVQPNFFGNPRDFLKIKEGRERTLGTLFVESWSHSIITYLSISMLN